MALRIKDNVDLKELEKFGFNKNKNGIFDRNISDLIRIIIMDTREILLNDVFGNFYCSIEILEKYIDDLIQAGLVEKIEE